MLFLATYATKQTVHLKFIKRKAHGLVNR